MNLHFIFKPQRRIVITMRMHSRPAHWRGPIPRDDGKSERPKKTVLRSFHVPKKVGIMHYPGHVRLREFHPTDHFEFVSHNQLGFPTTPVKAKNLTRKLGLH